MVTPAEGPHSDKDHFVHALGIELVAYGDGEATCSVRVTETLTNALGRSHGGLVLALADAAIARAANRPGQPSVVTTSTIQILRGSYPGQTLVADATALHRGGRLATYRADITADGKLVATVLAQSFHLDSSSAVAPAATRMPATPRV